MNKRILLTVALALPLFGMTHVYASDKVVLDINQVLELINEQNKDVSVARKSVQVSEQSVRVANAEKMPDISASLGVNFLGDITLMDRDFTNVMSASMPHLGNTLDVSLYQPVYAGGAITAGVNLAKQQNRMSVNQLEQTRQSAAIQAVSCYLELFKAYNLLNVYDENIANTQRVLNEMTARHAEGIVLKNDITRYELRLSTLNYDRLTINNRIAVLNHDLCLMLSLPETTEIGTNIDTELSSLPAIDSKASWQDATTQNSLTLKSLDITQSINEQQRKLLMADKLPHVGIVAGNNFGGPITFEVPVINKNYNSWYFGLNVKYNVSSLFKTSKSLTKNTLEREEIDRKRDAASDYLNRVIDETYTQYTQAYSMLQTEEKNVELATENYRIVENRYNNQLALLTDMLDASTAKLDAEVRLVNARVNIIYYYYQLKYNSGTL
jgi:outer membrane protein TolC